MTAQSLQRLSERLLAAGMERTELPDGSAVILDLTGNRVLTFSASGAYLIGVIQAGKVDSEQELAGILAEHYGIDQTQASADTREFVSSLQQALGM